MKNGLLYLLINLLIFSLYIIPGCSNGPTSPMPPLDSAIDTGGSHSCWGMWQFIADPVDGSLDVITLRSPDMHVNVIVFLEPPALVNLTLESLKFQGNLVEADIGLRHPFLGLTEFTGFDVCGILITNGSVTGFSDVNLVMAGDGDTRLLNPDGMTRWWNPAEFPVNTKTMYGYNDGLLGTPDSIADYNATINAYKYFCDDLTNPNDTLDKVNLSHRGYFSPGKKNIRHYTIELGAGLVFNYAVDASWIFPTGSQPWVVPDDFGPAANKREPWRAEVTEIVNTLWNDGTNSGGNLKLSIDVYDWFNAGLNKVSIESPGSFPAVGPVSPSGGGTGYSTYQVEINNAAPKSQGYIDVLIIAECEAVGYQNLLPGKTEAAYFLHKATVSNQQGVDPVCDIKVVTPMPYDGWASAIKFDASGSYDPLGGGLAYQWDFNNDGNFGDPYEYGTSEKPGKYFDADYVGKVFVRVISNTGQSECSAPVNITVHQSKNILLRNVEARDIALDHINGDLYVVYTDKAVYKHTRATYYQTSSAFATVQYTTVYHIDRTPDGFTVCGGVYAGGYPFSQCFDTSGASVFQYGHGGPAWCYDVIAMGSNGNYENDLGPLPGRNYSGNYQVIYYRAADEGWWPPTEHHNEKIIGSPKTGYDIIYWEYIKGAESDKNGDYVWILEDPDYYAARWKLTPPNPPVQYYGGIEYNNAHLGTGLQTDSDNGWNDGRDISRDNQNRCFVLDKLTTGQPRVKVWSVSGNITTSIGGFGNSTFISGEPRRIEGGDYSGEIVILHGGPTPPYMISVFTPSEMPE